MASKDIEVDEDNPNFFATLKLNQADVLVTHNEQAKKQFGFEFTDPDTIAILDRVNIPKKSLIGTPWYSLISNPGYVNDF